MSPVQSLQAVLQGMVAEIGLIAPCRDFLGHGIHCRDTGNRHYRKADPHYWYAENLEDPNDRGYDALRRLFLLEMARILR